MDEGGREERMENGVRGVKNGILNKVRRGK